MPLCALLAVPCTVCFLRSAEVQQLINSLKQLQQGTKVLQVLEQLQQQQLPSPGRPTPPGSNWNNLLNGTPAGNTSSSSGYGQQPLFRPHNAACTDWQRQLEQRRGASADGHLFLDELLQQLQQTARLPDSSPALAYPYQDVLTCIDLLFVSGSSGSSSSSREAWHAKLSVLLYYLLDGGWLASAEPFSQVCAKLLDEATLCQSVLSACLQCAVSGRKVHVIAPSLWPCLCVSRLQLTDRLLFAICHRLVSFAGFPAAADHGAAVAVPPPAGRSCRQQQRSSRCWLLGSAGQGMPLVGSYCLPQHTIQVHTKKRLRGCSFAPTQIEALRWVARLTQHACGLYAQALAVRTAMHLVARVLTLLLCLMPAVPCCAVQVC